jgi:hypothetical protein
MLAVIAFVIRVRRRRNKRWEEDDDDDEPPGTLPPAGDTVH